MTDTCVHRQLMEHFVSLELRLAACFETLRTKHRFLDMRTSAGLWRSAAERPSSMAPFRSCNSIPWPRDLQGLAPSLPTPLESLRLEGLMSHSANMDSAGFFTYVVAKRK